MSDPSTINFNVSLTHILEVSPFHFVNLWQLHFSAQPGCQEPNFISGSEWEDTHVKSPWIFQTGACVLPKCAHGSRGDAEELALKECVGYGSLKNTHSWKTLSPINWKNISYCGLFAKDSNSHEQAPLSSFENPDELCCHSPIRFMMKRKPGSCWETKGLPAPPNLSVGLSWALPTPQKADDITLGLILSIPHVVEAEAGISLLLFASFHNMKGVGRKLGVCIHICK